MFTPGVTANQGGLLGLRCNSATARVRGGRSPCSLQERVGGAKAIRGSSGAREFLGPNACHVPRGDAGAPAPQPPGLHPTDRGANGPAPLSCVGVAVAVYVVVVRAGGRGTTSVRHEESVGCP
jgi:hypothetical protein